MTDNPLLKKAIELILAGEKAQAQRILEAYIKENPHDVTAWLWEARTWSTLNARINVLETCLTYNPENPQIMTVLAALNTQRKQSESNKYALCLAQRLNEI
jgi:hypothetical protein